jgi:hypothetical protein
MQKEDPTGKKCCHSFGSLEFLPLHGRAIHDLKEEKVEENGSYVMHEEVEDMVAYWVELTNSVVECQAQIR